MDGSASIAPLVARWRALEEGEAAFDAVAAGDAERALRLCRAGRVDLVELIEHAADCRRLDVLDRLLAEEDEAPCSERREGSDSAQRAGPPRPRDADDPLAETKRLFDLAGAYEAVRRLLLERTGDADGRFEALRGATLERLLRLLEDRPWLAARRAHGGVTLLHVAAGGNDGALVERLLALGARADVADELGRTPLFGVANRVVPPARRTPTDGADVVAALARGGADPNRPAGLGRQTPLHAAARRGNVGVAVALLDHGAAIDPRDRTGETPLRRAVNCRQLVLVRRLSARGADWHAADTAGVTPRDAARQAGLAVPEVP